MKNSFLVFCLMVVTSPQLAWAEQTFEKKFDSPRRYSLHLFQTPQDCKNAQAGGRWFNCEQVINFKPDGHATVMVTDIMNMATYSIEGNQVVVKRTGAGDISEQMKFVIDHTGRNLIAVGRPEVWELEVREQCVPPAPLDFSFSECREDCKFNLERCEAKCEHSGNPDTCRQHCRRDYQVCVRHCG